METLRNYLENMFMNLPVTPEVLRAKQELAQMMEDKYNELKAEGRTENEAIGIVISEFGNLSELAEDLGINDAVRAHDSEMDMQPEGLHVNVQMAEAYLADKAKSAVRIGIGVMLCIFSVVGPILAAAVEDRPVFSTALPAGVAAMFIMIGCAVGLFVYSATKDSVWKELERGPLQMDFSTVEYIKNRKQSYHPTHTIFMTIGIVLCVVSVVPVTVFGILGDRASSGSQNAESMTIAAAASLFIFVGIGVMLIVQGSIRKEAFDRLLNAGGKTVASMSEDPEYADLTDTGKRVMSVYWTCVTCAYLAWSFLTFNWHITWIIWPIAAVFSKVLQAIFIKKEAL